MPVAARWKLVEVTTSRRGMMPSREDPARAVDVGEERLEREDPLADAALDRRPLVGGQDPRDEVERERSLLAGELERDPGVPERPVAGVAALLEVAPRQRLQDAVQRLVVLPGLGDRPANISS